MRESRTLYYTGHTIPLCVVCRHMNDEQSKEIEDSVLDRCMPHGGVVHTYVDRRSTLVSGVGKGSSLDQSVLVW